MSEPIISLWLVTGRNPVQFSIPVRVTDSNYRLLEVQTCTSLLKIQERVLSELLTQRSKVGERDGKEVWLISESELSKVATRAAPDVQDPETLLMWGRFTYDSRPENVRGRTADRDEFLEFCHSMGLGESREWVYFTWNQFCKLMMEWMINREKPVDLGFAKLHNCPFREDWKAILTWAFPKLGRGHRVTVSKKSDLMPKLVKNRQILEAMFSTDLLTMTRDENYCTRHVEIELKPEWYRVVEDVEKERLNRLGDHEYALYYLNSIKAGVSRWLAAYARWLLAVGRPSALCYPGDVPGRFRLVPSFRRGSMSWKDYLIGSFFNFAHRQFQTFDTDSAIKEILAENVGLPEVQSLQQETPLVRPLNGDVDKSTNT